MNLSRSMLVAVDVQKGFGKEAQSDKLQGLVDSEAQEIENVAKLAEAVHAQGGVVVVTKDWHSKPGTLTADGQIDNRAADEFKIHGEHCVGGTADAELNAPLERTVQRLERAEGLGRTVVPVDAYDDTGKRGAARVVEVHKNTFDVTKTVGLDGSVRPNRSFLDVLSQAKQGGIDTVLVAGKIAEVCVRAAAESIRALFPELRVVIVEDATSSLPAAVAQSIGLTPKSGVLAALEQQGVERARAATLLPADQFIFDGVEGR